MSSITICFPTSSKDRTTIYLTCPSDWFFLKPISYFEIFTGATATSGLARKKTCPNMCFPCPSGLLSKLALSTGKYMLLYSSAGSILESRRLLLVPTSSSRRGQGVRKAGPPWPCCPDGHWFILMANPTLVFIEDTTESSSSFLEEQTRVEARDRGPGSEFAKFDLVY